MKRCLKCILELLFLIILLPINVSANGKIYYDEVSYPCALDGKVYLKQDDEYVLNPLMQSYSLPTEYTETELLYELEELIKDAILQGETELYISAYQIDCNRFDISELCYFSPYLSNGIDLTFYYYDSYYSRIEIVNNMTEVETAKYFSEVEERVGTIKNLLSNYTSDESKALILHDYFVYEYEYDYDNYLTGEIPQDSYRSGGLLMNGTGVCQAYAYAYKYFLADEGVECYVTESTSMNHAWNIIKLEEVYYHVDVTWDDPVPDKLGKVYHGNFLVSDSAIQAGRNGSSRGHLGWDRTDLVCDNTQYDTAYWNDVKSQIVLNEESAYYIKDTYIYERLLSSDQETQLKDLGTWYVWNSSSYWGGAFSGLFMHEGELYYNTSTEICKISLDGIQDFVVYEPDISDGYIYGCALKGNILEYIIAQSPNEQGVVKTVQLFDEGKNNVGWQLDSIGWWYQEEDGSYPHDEWKLIDNKWYYFNASGYRVSGWLFLNDTWYYMDPTTGVMFADEWLNDTYYLQSSGSMATGWCLIDGNYYYFSQDGVKMTNAWIGNYYVKSDGVMAVSEWVEEYYVNETGAYIATTGWHYIDNGYYYLINGLRQKGWLLQGDTWYYLDVETGVMYAEKWLDDKYYLNVDGAMVTGWVLIDGDYYFFSESGVKCTDAWIGNYYVRSDGTMAVNEWIEDYYVEASGAYVSITGWYYLDGEYYYLVDGVRQKGWLQQGAVWYYLDPTTGVMAANEWVDGIYWMNESGVWIQGYKISDQYVQQLKAYILNNGEVNVDGNKFISISEYAEGTTFTFAIEYEAATDELDFIIVSDDGNGAVTATSMKAIEVENNTLYPRFAIMIDTLGCEAIAELNPATYTGQEDIYFIATITEGIVESNIQEVSNTMLQLGFAGWDYLAIEAGTNLNQIGFTAYQPLSE